MLAKALASLASAAAHAADSSITVFTPSTVRTDASVTRKAKQVSVEVRGAHGVPKLGLRE